LLSFSLEVRRWQQRTERIRENFALPAASLSELGQGELRRGRGEAKDRPDDGQLHEVALDQIQHLAQLLAVDSSEAEGGRERGRRGKGRAHLSSRRYWRSSAMSLSTVVASAREMSDERREEGDSHDLRVGGNSFAEETKSPQPPLLPSRRGDETDDPRVARFESVSESGRLGETADPASGSCGKVSKVLVCRGDRERERARSNQRRESNQPLRKTSPSAPWRSDSSCRRQEGGDKREGAEGDDQDGRGKSRG
jgi:hypothetical protein